MAVYKQDIVDIELNSGNVHRSFLKHSIGTADAKADHFGVRTFRGGVPVDLSGVSVQGYFRNSQGTNIAITSGNIVSGNVAEVVLPQACYNYEGPFCLAIKLIGDGVTGTMRIVDGIVDNTNTGSAVAPTGAVPTYSEVLAQYDAMVAATAAANGCTAETFDATKAYSAGKYVINSGALYRLTADHAANVTWANTSKVEVKFGNELTDVKSAINDFAETESETTTTEQTVTRNDGYYTNGSAYSSNSYFYVHIANLKPGDVLTAKYENNTINFRYVDAYNGSTRNASESKTSSVSSYTVHEGVDNVYLTCEKAYVYTSIKFYLTRTETTYVVTGLSDLENDVEELSTAVSDIENELSNIPTQNIKNISRTGHNYFNDVTVTYLGKYWNGSVGGNISTGTNASYNSYAIPIDRDGVYKYKTSDTSKLRFAYLVGSDNKVIEVNSEVTTITTTGKNAAYMAITTYATATSWELTYENEPSTEQYTVSEQWVFEDLVEDKAFDAYLPPEVCVGVGRTIELYNELVFLEADKYHLEWVCSVGVAYARKWSVTGTASNKGTYTLTLNIYDDKLNKVKTLSTTLKIIEDTLSANKKIIPIGDSLTNQKAWLDEVQTLANGNISYIGTRRGAYNAYTHEGRSGVSAAWYNGNNSYTYDNDYVGNPNVSGSSNPFWDGSKFSLSHYLSAQSGYVSTPDAVQLLLGTNGMNINPATNVNNIKAIVDSIRTEYENMPIFICNTIYRSNQNGYYSTGGQGYTAADDFQFDADKKVMNLQNALKTAFAEYSKVYIVPLSVCMDRENDFGQVEVSVNPRLTTVKTTIPNESIHPQTPGYMQMADVMYSSYIAHL